MNKRLIELCDIFEGLVFGESNKKSIPERMTISKIKDLIEKELKETNQTFAKIHVSFEDWAIMVDREVIPTLNDSATLQRLLTVYDSFRYHFGHGGYVEVLPSPSLNNGEYKIGELKRYRSIIAGECKYCGTDPGEGSQCVNCGATTAWN
ncbi:hypothetical protein [Leptospira andrefontaineae]|uniref:Uncharacterized protein n=1 Tax=Leptospira andrefontaineae TaxID=2484976 RepID=A0A4R9GWU4_9LEPT|nr:hypothetical protein [Leptospira andrefontaineae]TGK36235.1 hypothetical protein EHO65_18195 [Leptospira andrefontaineae]